MKLINPDQEITITKEDFADVCAKVGSRTLESILDEEDDTSFILFIASFIAALCADLTKELFEKEEKE